MPIASIVKVCECSSQDPKYPAVNLLDAKSEKKWKTRANGEKLAYVILQLEKPEIITGIDVGNEHSAFIEIYVGKSKDIPVKFIELVSTSLFMTPFESKKSLYADRMRSFGKEKIIQTNAQKWDLIKIICTQPFNKHIQYGLSFIKIRAKPSGNKVVRRKIVPKESVDTSLADYEKSESSLKEKNEESNEIISNEIEKINSEDKIENNDNNSYHIIPQVEIEVNEVDPIWDKKGNDLLKSQTNFKQEDTSSLLEFQSEQANNEVVSIGSIDKALKAIEKAEQISNEVLSDMRNSEDKSIIRKKSGGLRIAIQQHQFKRLIPISNISTTRKPNEDVTHKPFDKLFEDVVFVISGLQNPDHSEVRLKAENMGGKYEKEWKTGCTHLVCVFKDTPKYKLVKRNEGKIVKRNWVEACYIARKRLPWRRFALDSDELNKIESEREIFELILNSSKSNSHFNGTENITKVEQNEKLNYGLNQKINNNLLPKKSNLQTGIKGNQMKNKTTKFLLPENDNPNNSCEVNGTISNDGQDETIDLANNKSTVSQQRNKFENIIDQSMPTKLQRGNPLKNLVISRQL